MRLLQEFLYDDRKMVCDVIDSGVPEMTYTEVSTLIAARATTQRTIEDTGKSPSATVYTQLLDSVAILGSCGGSGLKVDTVSAQASSRLQGRGLRFRELAELVPDVLLLKELVGEWPGRVVRTDAVSGDVLGVREHGACEHVPEAGDGSEEEAQWRELGRGMSEGSGGGAHAYSPTRSARCE